MSEVKRYIEDNKAFLSKKTELEELIMNFDGRNPYAEESIMDRLDELERWESNVLNIIFQSDTLSDRQAAVIMQVMDGVEKKEIGRAFDVSVQRVRQILNQSYELITNELEQKRRMLCIK